MELRRDDWAKRCVLDTNTEYLYIFNDYTEMGISRQRSFLQLKFIRIF